MSDQAPMQPKGNPDLYRHATDMMKEAYKKPKHNGEKHKKHVGHILQSQFGRKVWTLKDLDDAQLLQIMGQSNKLIERKKIRAAKKL